MAELSAEAKQMLEESHWSPHPDWDYYCQQLDELSLTLHDAAKSFLDTYHNLSITYTIPELEAEITENESFDEDYYHRFRFSDEYIDDIDILYSEFSLLSYSQEQKQNFLPIGEVSSQFGNSYFTALMIVGEMNQVHLIDPNGMPWRKFDSCEDFFNAIAQKVFWR